MSSNPPKYTGIIAWFAQNSVAANLLMVFIIVAGLMSYQSINKKMFPDYSPNIIQVSVAHLGAAPEEVEQSVILKVEEAIEILKTEEIRAEEKPALKEEALKEFTIVSMLKNAKRFSRNGVLQKNHMFQKCLRILQTNTMLITV